MAHKLMSGIPLRAATHKVMMSLGIPPQFGNSLSKSAVITDLRKGCFPILRQIGRLKIRAGLPAGDCLVLTMLFRHYHYSKLINISNEEVNSNDQ